MRLGLYKNVKVELIRRDMTPGSPTYGQDLDTLEVYGEDAHEGVCWLKGFSGLMHAQRTQVKEAFAYQEGVTLSDFPRVDERTANVRLATKAKNPEDLMTLETRLWKILSFKRDAILKITSATATRELKIRLNEKPEDAMDYFMGEVLHMVWDITLLSWDPWWYSATIMSSWTRGSATPDGSGWYSGTLEFQNPADQTCWIQFSNREITVPETWSLPDALAVYPPGHAKAGQPVMHTLPELGVGKSFLVQTNPLEPTLTVMDNSQEQAKMRMEDFLSWLPEDMTTPVIVPVKLKGGTADSKVTAFMVQRHDRPWS
ncbi:minor tail protein [Gordonia phage GMA2]|uniref:Minor tail protein n=1 Tax=Gordonia phage GMA2 TaxID=1647283 RepID=A0A0K0N752_9CAUD|nr:minor tail protein [Gordonia phage GMA2]AKJ72567.1 hypothetical protein GMA2_29 [Gordonia phage GMA2]